MGITVAYLLPDLCCAAVGAAQKFTGFVNAYFRKIFHNSRPSVLLENRAEKAGTDSYMGRDPVL